jgi:membrane-associated phospholipid phosphatase
MADYLNWLDHKIFYWIQANLRSDFFDPVFLALRDKYFWFPLYLFLLTWLILQFRWKSLYWILIISALITISDQMSSSVLKKIFKRSRPCMEEYFKEQFTPLIGCSRGYSLPSSHAANHMTIGAFIFFSLGSRMQRGRWFFLVWGLPVGFAQVYIGVHFPFDVMAGWIVGLTIALIFHALVLKLKFNKV